MPSGGLAAYRRTAFERAGGFDERLFAYGEHVDLGLRMRLDGLDRGGGARGPRDPRGRSDDRRRLTPPARAVRIRPLASCSPRYGVLRTRACPRALLFEALVVGWGLVAHRTTIPLRARVRGWRAGAGERLPIPPQAIDRSIGAREAFRRLRQAR